MTTNFPFFSSEFARFFFFCRFFIFPSIFCPNFRPHFARISGFQVFVIFGGGGGTVPPSPPPASYTPMLNGNSFKSKRVEQTQKVLNKCSKLENSPSF